MTTSKSPIRCNSVMEFIIPLTSIVQHVSSVMSLIIRNLNCIWASGLRTPVETARDAVWVGTQTASRAVSTSVCKPEAPIHLEVPDDERHNARNMLNYWRKWNNKFRNWVASCWWFTSSQFIRIAYWTPKATNTHSEYVIHIVFPLQQWLQEGASMLRYTYVACLVCYVCVLAGL
jgi:hypothetical protein